MDERRILAVDPGERRVGLAVSDPLGITAQGIDTFDRSRGDLFAHLAGVIDAYHVVEIVVGHPLSMSGDEGAAGRAARAFAAELKRRFGIDVVLWDERLSSVEAGRVLAGSKAARKNKGAVDRVAAALILQSYLDARGNSG